jgi:hypothetical protein
MRLKDVGILYLVVVVVVVTVVVRINGRNGKNRGGLYILYIVLVNACCHLLDKNRENFGMIHYPV